MSNNNILKIKQASEHNLKDIDVSIPHNALTVITGVSGSGKSSLAYSVIFKESQRRFLESFSTYSRQYLGKMEKPKVESITGLQAAISIKQKTVVSNPRSTVGTLSGIYDYLRLLFARISDSKCPSCHLRIDNKEKNCLSCGYEPAKKLASLFSFNSKYGACPQCNGLGITEQIDKQKLIADPNKTLAQGALVPTTPTGYIVYSQVRVDELDKVCQAHGFSVNIPWNQLTQEQQEVIWYGSDRVKILFGKHSLESRLKWKGITAKPREEAFYKGMIPIMEDILKRDRNDNILRFASAFTCHECKGQRLNKDARSAIINEKNISEISQLSIDKLAVELKVITKSIGDHDVLETILEPIFKRIKYLRLLGLEYLTLSRESGTLSGGESQRIRLASQIGSGLQGILYILDEPSIGLHPRDNKKLIQVLQSLRDNGNTVVVVEHDEETIKAADYLIDIGPGAGINGGKLVFQGESHLLFEDPKAYPLSKTADSILANKHKGIKTSTRTDKGSIFINNARKHNLKNIDAEFKLKAFNVVTGVSGAGKSTLVHHILGQYLRKPTDISAQINIDTDISRVIEIDQSPIGRTPRSNPATYTDLFDHIREIFGKLPMSKEKGFKKGDFSFNNKGGRCEHCQGAGYTQLGMHFLGDIEIVCEKCHGKRFTQELLEVKYKDLTIYDILNLSIIQSRDFFSEHQKITKILDILIKLEVGYLKLGQPSTTLSGGEAQRIKLASELYKTAKGHRLYILDEPTMGLHKSDIAHLLIALNEIVDKGHTMIVIEHDTDIIKQADWIVDLGPEGGENGGELIVQGPPQDIMNCTESFTGQALKDLFKETEYLQNKLQQTASNIILKGINTNNLKNIDIEIPLNRTTVITGISGSGKSSLAFDTLYAESRNRYTENFSSYARRTMAKTKKPDFEHSSGLTPAIGIRQTPFNKNPRSTVGTISEIYDLYRLLFSRLGITKKGQATKLPASMFSYNNAEAACPHCKGLGIITSANPEKYISHPHLSLLNGAMQGSVPGKFFGDINGQYINTLLKVGETEKIDFDQPFKLLNKKAKDIALHGTKDIVYDVAWKFKRDNRTGTHQLKTVWKGFTQLLNEEFELKRNSKKAHSYEVIMSDDSCPVCRGEKLNKTTLDTTFNGENISQISNRSINETKTYFKNLINEIDAKIYQKSQHIIQQIIEKCHILEQIGLSYISVNRRISSLSGGESQRLRIASQIISNLCGLTYIFDEPTIGLHPKDTQSLMASIKKLKENGNTVVLVEHDPDVIAMADHIIDMGPAAGDDGGEIIAHGNLNDLLKNKQSITGIYMHKYLNNSPNQKEKTVEHKAIASEIIIKKASAHNLKNIDLQFPTNQFITVTGVSGSGKTSLVFDVLADSFNAGRPINCEGISFGNIKNTLLITQEKIGLSPLSTAATYTGIFDHIRDIFSKLDESKARKLKKSHFSFNSKDGGCPVCKGMGQQKVSLDFLSDVWTTCEQCHGNRYKKEILEVYFQTYNINDILNLSSAQALSVFESYPKIHKKLQVLNDIGLGYIKLGQATTTLSGGETQRLKLAYKLQSEQPANTLFIFDEPSTGLHMQDVEKLLSVLNKLVKKGNTVIVIEHNISIIQAADWIIDLGPDGGDAGGDIVYNGQSENLISCDKSYTAQYLKTY